MRFLKFNSLLLLMQIWNDLTRWLVLYNSWIALISCWWFGIFSSTPLPMNVFCTGFLCAPIKWPLCALPVFQRLSYTPDVRSGQSGAPDLCLATLSWACMRPTGSSGKRMGQGAFAQAASSPPLLQAPKETRGSKGIILKWWLQPLLNMSWGPGSLQKQLQCKFYFILTPFLWSRYFHSYFQIKKLSFRDYTQPYQGHKAQEETCREGEALAS